MEKKMKSKNAILISFVILFGLLSLILFLTIPDERLGATVFWLAFSLSVPVNFLALCGFTVWGFSKSGSAFAKLTVSLYTSGAFAALLLIVGAIFMYLPFESLTFPIIVYAIITAAYLIASIYANLGAKAIAKADEKPPVFLKLLEVDVLDCAGKTSSPAIRESLLSFAEKIRYSDPISHSSLGAMEGLLSTAVFDISTELSTNPDADVSEKIKAAEGMLASRNNRCLVLKQCGK